MATNTRDNTPKILTTKHLIDSNSRGPGILTLAERVRFSTARASSQGRGF
jgi:hypothetical protein